MDMRMRMRVAWSRATDCAYGSLVLSYPVYIILPLLKEVGRPLQGTRHRHTAKPKQSSHRREEDDAVFLRYECTAFSSLTQASGSRERVQSCQSVFS